MQQPPNPYPQYPQFQQQPQQQPNFTQPQTYYPLQQKWQQSNTHPPVTSNVSVTTSPMALIIASNDNQGNISGRVGILLAPNGVDPFIGTLRVDGTITFTATPLFIGVFTIFTGKVNGDGSIRGTTINIYQPASWTLFPVKG